MKKFKISKLSMVFSAICLLCIFFTGCSLFEGKKYDESYTDSDGNTYYIVNKNYIDFSVNNVLEVVVSESERFILYGYDFETTTPEQQMECGYGEWIINGKSIPIYFSNDNYGSSLYLHGDILISYYNYDGEDMRLTQSDSIYIAKIKNNPKQPELRWCIDGEYVYAPKFSEDIVTVKYRTYTRTEGMKDIPSNPSVYVPISESPFYSIPEDTSALYKFELYEEKFVFDGRTNNGTWTKNGIENPVILSINEESFSFTVCYNTDDEKNGQVIISGYGTWLSDSKAKYNVNYFCDEIDGAVFNIIIEKEWTYPSKEWEEFISVEDDKNASYICEKGNFSCDAKSMQGFWLTNNVSVLIRIEFDPLSYQMKIYDAYTNECILSAKGNMQDENTAVFTEYTGNMFYNNTLGDIVVKKQ